MTWYMRVAAAAGISVCIAFALSMLPGLESKGRQAGLERHVFQPTPLAMNGEVAVHELARLKLHTVIRKVDWSAELLSVDLVAERSLTSVELTEDLAAMAELGLSEKPSVKSVLVRVIDASDARLSPVLLVAMEASRHRMSSQLLEQLKERRTSVKELIGKEIPLTWGPRGKPRT